MWAVCLIVSGLAAAETTFCQPFLFGLIEFGCRRLHKDILGAAFGIILGPQRWSVVSFVGALTLDSPTNLLLEVFPEVYASLG